jgi:hypothetical protein
LRRASAKVGLPAAVSARALMGAFALRQGLFHFSPVEGGLEAEGRQLFSAALVVT